MTTEQLVVSIAIVVLLLVQIALGVKMILPGKPREVDLNAAAWSRWLRAGRPADLRWFLALGEPEQEALAGLGESWAEDLALGLAWAIKDPEAAEIGSRAAGGDPDAESALLARATASMHPSVATHLSALSSAPLDAVASSWVGGSPAMGGMGERKQAREQAANGLRSSFRTLAGRRPDGAT